MEARREVRGSGAAERDGLIGGGWRREGKNRTVEGEKSR